MAQGETRSKFLETLDRRIQEALSAGALEAISSRCEVVEQAGVAFQIRVASNPAQSLRPLAASKRSDNPFLPYDPALFVAELSGSHVCLLNKFTVIDRHLLIVTRELEQQESLLTSEDFEALWSCLAEVDGLAFYNAGPIAGASQPHKHLQLVPLPLLSTNGPGEPRLPIETLLAAARFENRVGRIPGLPFLHAFARLDGAAEGSAAAVADELLGLYHALRQAAATGDAPYNLLLTRDWMLYVPRSAPRCEAIEVNALGFAGSFFVRSTSELDRVRALGPMNILRAVAMC